MQLPFEEEVQDLLREAIGIGGLAATKPSIPTMRMIKAYLGNLHERLVGVPPEDDLFDAIGVTPGQVFDPGEAASKFVDIVLSARASRHIREDPIWVFRKR